MPGARLNVDVGATPMPKPESVGKPMADNPQVRKALEPMARRKRLIERLFAGAVVRAEPYGLARLLRTVA